MTNAEQVAMGGLALTMIVQACTTAFFMGALVQRVKHLETGALDHGSIADEVIKIGVLIEQFGKRLDEVVKGLTWLTLTPPEAIERSRGARSRKTAS